MEQATSQTTSATTNKSEVAFDRAVWVASKGVKDKTNARFPMLDSAQALLSKGMTQDKVLEILGEPDSRSEARWAYIVRPDVQFSHAHDILVIGFANGKVTEFGWSSNG